MKKKVFDVVREVLSKSERARDDDKWLSYLVMRQYTKIYIPFEDFEKIPAFETITRHKRKIQQKGEFRSKKELIKEQPQSVLVNSHLSY